MTQRVNLPSHALMALSSWLLPSGDPGEGTGDGVGDGAGGSFSLGDSVSTGVNGRVETTRGVAGGGNCVNITSQAGRPGLAITRAWAAGKPPHGAYSASRYLAEVPASRRLSRRRACPSPGGNVETPS